MPDPSLTERGEQQCRELQAHLRKNCPLALRVERIVVSPLRRTLQTALLALDWLIESGIFVEANAQWQENSDKPCDTGTCLETIIAEFPSLDFSAVDPAFTDKSSDSIYAFTEKATCARGAACLQDLYVRHEKVIAVVSHAAFLRTAISKCRYANADYRIFTFRKASDGVLELHEDVQTESCGGGMGKSRKGVYNIVPSDFPLEKIAETEEDAIV